MKLWNALLALLIMLIPTACFAAFAIFQAYNPLGAGGGPNLRQQNIFGLTGSAWQDTGNYYTPGTGNPAVSTADYYHQNGLSWTRPYDLTATDCGSTGASIAASRGRYVWVSAPDHPAGPTWPGGNDFVIGFSNDPGVMPDQMQTIYSSYATPVDGTAANITGSISGNTLTVSAVSAGVIGGDGRSYITGAGVTQAQITVQLTGSPAGGVGTYTIAGSPQTVGSQSMTVIQQGYWIYQNPSFVCNPDDATYPFYVYAEGQAAGGGVAHEQGFMRSSDLTTWTSPAPSHPTISFGSWSSYQRIIRAGVNDWYSVGFEFQFPNNGSVYARGKWTSTDGRLWNPGTVTLNWCIPASAQSGTSVDCTGTNVIAAGQDATPQWTVSAQLWVAAQLNSFTGGVRSGDQWVGRVPLDANFNVIDSPAHQKVSSAYAGIYPGPTYLQSVSAYVEDGIAHYWGLTGFFSSSSLFGLVNYATYANGGGLWQQGFDYYTEIVDATAAAGAAPVGVRASCAASTASVTWTTGVLPTDTMRLYRGTTAGSQTTLVGDFSGGSATDTGMSLNAVTYYKLVYLNSGVEKQNRVVSTYCSTSIALVNAHITRALAGGADASTIDRTWLDTFTAWLSSNSLTNNLRFATAVDFGVVKSGSVISKIFDLGTTRLPRGGDYTTLTSGTTYSATGIHSLPSWVSAANGDGGYYGAGKPQNLRRMTQITVFSAYQKSHTNSIIPFVYGESTNLTYLQHGSGTPGTLSFSLSDATQQKTATSSISGSATDFHTAAGVWDGTTLTAYSDGAAGAGTQTGLVIPSPNLNPPDILTGSVNENQIPMINVGSSIGTWSKTTYLPSSCCTAANFNGGILIIFDKGLSAAQISSLNTLLRTHYGY